MNTPISMFRPHPFARPARALVQSRCLTPRHADPMPTRHARLFPIIAPPHGARAGT
ncbi:hypothetical protein [Luteimonas viscosa]|uniref:hypothetical protein n=1 Tax=Luteimonas viscosa TaxID=1132694 RepID=UPI0021CCA3BF|nr:hypothetical protein [Luteimonas viscosa]